MNSPARWEDMTKEERVTSIRGLYPAHSSTAVARLLGASSRNVIIGFIHRHLKDLIGPPIIRRSRAEQAGRPARAVPARAPKVPRVAEPKVPRVASPQKVRAAVAAEIADPTMRFLADGRRYKVHCSWISGDPLAVAPEELMVCGRPCEDGSPYCPGHSTIAHDAAPPRRRSELRAGASFHAPSPMGKGW